MTKTVCPSAQARKVVGLTVLSSVLIGVGAFLMTPVHERVPDSPAFEVGRAPSPPPPPTASTTPSPGAPHALLGPLLGNGGTPTPTPTPGPSVPAPPAPHPADRGKGATVVRVVDGDTVVVVLDGAQTTLRLIGLDTPETVAPGKPVECFGPDASAEAKRLMPPKSTVRLHFDPTQGTLTADGHRVDRYGRVLAYVQLPGGLDYAEHMIATGHGVEYQYAKRYGRVDTYREAQTHAQATSAGLWGACRGG